MMTQSEALLKNYIDEMFIPDPDGSSHQTSVKNELSNHLKKDSVLNKLEKSISTLENSILESSLSVSFTKAIQEIVDAVFNCSKVCFEEISSFLGDHQKSHWFGIGKIDRTHQSNFFWAHNILFRANKGEIFLEKILSKIFSEKQFDWLFLLTFVKPHLLFDFLTKNTDNSANGIKNIIRDSNFNILDVLTSIIKLEKDMSSLPRETADFIKKNFHCAYLNIVLIFQISKQDDLKDISQLIAEAEYTELANETLLLLDKNINIESKINHEIFIKKIEDKLNTLDQDTHNPLLFSLKKRLNRATKAHTISETISLKGGSILLKISFEILKLSSKDFSNPNCIPILIKFISTSTANKTLNFVFSTPALYHPIVAKYPSKFSSKFGLDGDPEAYSKLFEKLGKGKFDPKASTDDLFSATLRMINHCVIEELKSEKCEFAHVEHAFSNYYMTDDALKELINFLKRNPKTTLSHPIEILKKQCFFSKEAKIIEKDYLLDLFTYIFDHLELTAEQKKECSTLLSKHEIFGPFDRSKKNDLLMKLNPKGNNSETGFLTKLSGLFSFDDKNGNKKSSTSLNEEQPANQSYDQKPKSPKRI